MEFGGRSLLDGVMVGGVCWMVVCGSNVGFVMAFFCIWVVGLLLTGVDRGTGVLLVKCCNRFGV